MCTLSQGCFAVNLLGEKRGPGWGREGVGVVNVLNNMHMCEDKFSSTKCSDNAELDEILKAAKQRHST